MIYRLNEPGYPFDISMNISGMSDKVNEHAFAIEVLEATQIYPPGDSYNWFRPRNIEALRAIDPNSRHKFVRIQVDCDNARTIEAIFSEELNHIDVMHTLIDVTFGYCHDVGRCIAAGFVKGDRYFGRSESIGIDYKGNE